MNIFFPRQKKEKGKVNGGKLIVGPRVKGQFGLQNPEANDYKKKVELEVRSTSCIIRVPYKSFPSHSLHSTSQAQMQRLCLVS